MWQFMKKLQLQCINFFIGNHTQGFIVLAGDMHLVTHINYQQICGKVSERFVVLIDFQINSDFLSSLMF